MEAITLIGFFIFIGALFYLVYHLIKKVKNRDRKLPKRKFYPALISGFLLFIIGGTMIDTGVQDQLNEALKENAALLAENDKYESNNKLLKKANEKLKDEITEVNEKLEETTSKLEEFDKMQEELAGLNSSHATEKEALEKEITSLKEKNTALNSEVDSLKGQVANNSSSSSAGSGSGSNSKSQTTTAPATSGETEWFQNCTELRKKYPNGVASDHPAYQSKMDRDKDGWACER